MGKWAEVHCDCPNRVPLPNSDSSYGRPHRNKRRLSRAERDEVEVWKRTTEDMYECGHRNGAVIELWPGHVIRLGRLVRKAFGEDDNTFEVFPKIGDWNSYEDELLLISPEEAQLWLMEVRELQAAMAGEENLPARKVEQVLLGFFNEQVGIVRSLHAGLNAATEKVRLPRLTAMRRNIEKLEQPTVESTSEAMAAALADAADFCEASIKTNNPVRLML